MLLKIGLSVVAVIILLLVVISTRPSAFHIERTATISAPAAVVFGQISDFYQWDKWNPFEKSDPTVRKIFDGEPAEIGSSFYYVGEEIGEGRMTLVDAVPDRRVAIRAEFIKPFAAINDVEFTLRPNGDGTSVSWVMSGENTFVGKALSLFMNMDEMVGSEFEKGLADLKEVSEQEARYTS